VVGCSEHGNEPSGSIEVGKSLDQQSYFYVIVIFSVKICILNPNLSCNSVSSLLSNTI
jgi:hypothetical protein